MKLDKSKKELQFILNALKWECAFVIVGLLFIFLSASFDYYNIPILNILYLLFVGQLPFVLFCLIPITVSSYFNTKEDIARETEKMEDMKAMGSDYSEDEIVEEIVKDDENFSLELFYKEMESKFKKIYLREDSDYVRSFVSKKVIDKVDRIDNSEFKIVMVNIYDMKVKDDYRYLNVRVRTDIESDNGRNRRIYNLSLKRKLGVKSYNNERTNCPNCGSVLSIHSDGLCDYCKKSILSGDYDWVVIDVTNTEVKDNYIKDLTSKDGTYLRDTVTYDEFLEMDKDQDGSINFLERFPKSEEEVVKEVLDVDNRFSVDYFKDYIKFVYDKFMNAYIKGDIKLIRPFVNDKFYQAFKINEIDGNKDIKNDYSFKGIMVKEFKVEGDREIITVAFTVDSKIALDYKVKHYDLLKDGKARTLRYLMTFSRRKGLKSDNKKLDEYMLRCPNCSNEINLNELGECSYCGTNVTNGNYGWTVVDLKNVNVKNK